MSVANVDSAQATEVTDKFDSNSGHAATVAPGAKTSIVLTNNDGLLPRATMYAIELVDTPGNKARSSFLVGFDAKCVNTIVSDCSTVPPPMQTTARPAMTAYVSPAAGKTRGCITGALLDELPPQVIPININTPWASLAVVPPEIPASTVADAAIMLTVAVGLLISIVANDGGGGVANAPFCTESVRLFAVVIDVIFRCDPLRAFVVLRTAFKRCTTLFDPVTKIVLFRSGAPVVVATGTGFAVSSCEATVGTNGSDVNVIDRRNAMDFASSVLVAVCDAAKFNSTPKAEVTYSHRPPNDVDL